MENPIEVQKQARSFRNVPTRQLATFYYNQLMQFKRLGAHYLGMSNTVEELLCCALPSWYSNLHHRTIKSEFVELPQEFVEYLTSDGIVLPKDCDLPLILRGEEEKEQWGDPSLDTPPDDEDQVPSFPELLPRITAAISALGGRGVFPKLNWSAPKDAGWIATTNSLCCTTPAEVILLLKSSDFIAHDISRLSEMNSSPQQLQSPLRCTLCLRQWKDINPSSEFRCFVRDCEVIGACQRDFMTHYPFLLPLREKLLQEILCFHQHHLSDAVALKNYTFDVIREEEGDYVLVDLNPFSSLTDSLLYSWEELEAWQEEAPELRLVGAGCIQPSHHQACRLPKDIVDLSTGEDINKFVDLFQSNSLDKS